MKIKIALPFLAAILFYTKGSCGVLELEKAIQYTPPLPVSPMRTSLNVGDDLFTLDALGFQNLPYDQCSSVYFELGKVRFRFEKGVGIRFLSASPADLKDELESEWKDKVPNAPPATIGKLDGFTAISLTASRPANIKPSLFQTFWIQIETNVVLKVVAASCDVATFKTLTNSLQSLRIDKLQLLDSLKPKEPEITTNHLEKVEVGYIHQNGKRISAAIFYTKEGLFSFTAGITSNPDDAMKDASANFAKLQNYSSQTNALRIVVIDISQEYQQTALCIGAETNAAAINRLQIEDIRSPQALLRLQTVVLIWKFWENQVPEGFQKKAEYNMDAILYIRKEPSQ